MRTTIINNKLLNILCVTYFVTSSVAVFEAATWVKLMYMTKSWLKTRKKTFGNQSNCS